MLADILANTKISKSPCWYWSKTSMTLIKTSMFLVWQIAINVIHFPKYNGLNMWATKSITWMIIYLPVKSMDLLLNVPNMKKNIMIMKMPWPSRLKLWKPFSQFPSSSDMVLVTEMILNKWNKFSDTETK